MPSSLHMQWRGCGNHICDAISQNGTPYGVTVCSFVWPNCSSWDPWPLWPHQPPPPPTPSHHMWWSQIEVNYKASQICCHPFEHPLNTGYYTTYEACLAKEDIAALERSITESCVSVARCIWWIYGFNALRMIRAKFTKVYQVSVVQHYLYAIVSA